MRFEMATVGHEELIRGTAESLFDLAQDYKVRMAWDPFPESYSFHGASAPATGVEMTGKAKNGFSMHVRYVSFNRPRVAAIEMVKGPWFFKRFAGAWQFLPESDGVCRVSFKYSVEGRCGPLSPLVTKLLARSLARHARQRLLCLKNFAEARMDVQENAAVGARP